MHSPFLICCPTQWKETVNRVVNKFGDCLQKMIKYWLGGEGEFAVFQKNKLIDTFLLRSYQTQSNTHINIIYKDSQDRLWMGTYLNGILLYDPQNKKMTRIGKTSHEETLNVHCFYEDKKGVSGLGRRADFISMKTESWKWQVSFKASCRIQRYMVS